MVRGLHAHRAGLDSFGFTEVAAALCVFAGVWPVTQSRAAGADGDGTERKKHPTETTALCNGFYYKTTEYSEYYLPHPSLIRK